MANIEQDIAEMVSAFGQRLGFYFGNYEQEKRKLIEDFLSSQSRGLVEKAFAAIAEEKKSEISVVQHEEIYAEGWNSALFSVEEAKKKYLST